MLTVRPNEKSSPSHLLPATESSRFTENATVAPFAASNAIGATRPFFSPSPAANSSPFLFVAPTVSTLRFAREPSPIIFARFACISGHAGFGTVSMFSTNLPHSLPSQCPQVVVTTPFVWQAMRLHPPESFGSSAMPHRWM